MDKLEKLLYRKGTTERLMGIWSTGIKMYHEYNEACKVVIKDKKRSKLERAEATKNLHEAEVPYRHYITSFNFAKREYENHIIPEIEQLVTNAQKKSIEFKDLAKLYDDLAEIDIFGDWGKQPANIELVEINDSIEKHIKLLKQIISESVAKSKTTKDSYEKAKLNLDVFTYQLHITSNKKRLSERRDYYLNQFKPKYDADMLDAKKYLDKMIERANEIVRLGIDPKLPFMLQEYKKNKGDKEKVWVFYVALKARLKSISKEMRSKKSQFKGKMHLAELIVN